jgi:hypothetical protein
MYRIEQYLDNFSRVAFLREVDGDLNPTQSDHIVVVAREYDGDNRVTRAWFLGLQTQCDGLSVCKIPHRVVSPRIIPGEPSKPADPIAQSAGGMSQEVLVKIKQLQTQQAKELERHLVYCREWRQHLATIAEQAAKIQKLESSLTEADGRNRKFGQRAIALGSELQATKAGLEALRQKKSLTHRVREWGRSWSIRND